MRRLPPATAFLPLLVLVALVAGCGGGEQTVTVTETVVRTVTRPPPRPRTASLRVYLLQAGKIAPVRRDAPATAGVARAAWGELLAGPTAEERSRGLGSAVPAAATLVRLSVGGGVATVELDTELTLEATGQLVYTLTQFPSVRSVELDGRRLARSDLEDVTPAILVESPLPGDAVSSPIPVRGTANTFEATFEYELLDPSGKVLSSDFVTATSGSGTRGTFDFTIPFEAPSGLGELVVFERSAADGSRIHQLEIPLQLER